MWKKGCGKKIIAILLCGFVFFGITTEVFAENLKKVSMLNTLMIHTGALPNDQTVLLKNETDTYQTELVFQKEAYTYQLNGIIYDNSLPQLGFRTKAENPEDTVLLLCDGKSQEISSDKKISKYVNFFTAGKKEFSILVMSQDDQMMPARYKFSVDVIPTIASLTSDQGYWSEEFHANTAEYVLTIPSDVTTLNFQAVPTTDGAKITFQGEESGSVNISETDEVKIVAEMDGVKNIYTVKLDKRQKAVWSPVVTPADALVAVCDQKGERLEPKEDGSYAGMFGLFEHTYTVSKNGYVTVNGLVPADGGKTFVTLEPVEGKQPEEAAASWKNFRNSDVNMAITDAKTPRTEDASKVSPKWISDFRSQAGAYPSVQIIVDHALVLMSGNTLYKLDLNTGKILQKAEMAEAPNFGYTPPTYAAGMIFCPLANGTIQAFHAKTLESLWIYEDVLGGQSLSPITYADGYLYTGFWNGESENANFVCLSITDEDTKQTKEKKQAVWTYTQKGGFYWAGSVVANHAVIVGTDDGMGEGTNGTSLLYSFEKNSGKVISQLKLTDAGDQRSSVAYDKEHGKIYFTTKGGYLYQAAVNESNGKITDLKKLKFQAASTSTPVIYKNRIYFGVGNGFHEGEIAVVDGESFKTLFTVPMKGYPQCSLLLSTAYENTGYLYLYSTYNNKPGGISAVKVKVDCKVKADAAVTELFLAQGYEEFCIMSVICDENGILYYKNDSGNVFALGIPTYENVVTLIDEIGEVSLQSEGKISSAREAYDALNDNDKKMVSNYAVLQTAEQTLKGLKQSAQKAEDVMAIIRKIGIVTLNSEEKIRAARNAYDGLSSYEKSLVLNLSTLEYAEEKYDRLKEDAEQSATHQEETQKETVQETVREETKVIETETVEPEPVKKSEVSKEKKKTVKEKKKDIETEIASVETEETLAEEAVQEEVLEELLELPSITESEEDEEPLTVYPPLEEEPVEEPAEVSNPMGIRCLGLAMAGGFLLGAMICVRMNDSEEE